MDPKSKDKIDEVIIETFKDRQGYDAYKAELKFKGKLINVLLCEDITHRKFCEHIAKIIKEKYEVVNTPTKSA